jgi:2-methylcitrate dehydratase PrpD
MGGGEEETITGGRLVTRELAEWIANLRYEDLPDDVTAEAGRALVDYLGECLFVGGTKPLGQEIAKFCAINGGGQPEATIIATGKKVMVSRAALANGTMALGFEYADYGAGSRPYPFSVNGPLCLAEFRKLSGKQLALAIVIGYEVMWRTFKSMHPKGMTGFYTPAVYGTLGSAAACARLLDLSVDGITKAIGFGVAQTGGTFQGHEEGAWQRCLNGGLAGERGVTAALLAESGYQGIEMAFEGIQGFSRMFCGGELRADAMFEDLGKSFIITSRWVKAYPMNTTLHAPTEALLKVMDANNLHFSEIEEISAAWQKVEPFLAKHKVSTVVSAQASLPFALSMAAVRRKVTIDEFTDETVNDADIQAMIPRVKVTQDLELYQRVKNSMPGRVTVRTKDGREFTDEVLYPRGNPSNPLSEAEFKHKFMEMAERVLGHDQADELYQRAIALTDIADVSELAPLFSKR